MDARNLFHWLREYVYYYNVFIPEEYDDDGDEHHTTQNPTAVIKYQLYATRLYVPLLIMTVYILTFIVVIFPPTQQVIVTNINPSLFEQLYEQHGETLHCSCSTASIPYKDFATNTVAFHPLCSSVYVSKEWIEALYSPYVSAYFAMDFRKSASSQQLHEYLDSTYELEFELLAAFCLICNETISQLLADFNTRQLISLELLRDEDVRFRIMTDVEIVRANAPVEVVTTLHLLQIANQQNSLISALRSNIFVGAYT
ncbi:unnamed protein product, partial [Adineta ricciae]